MNNRTSSFYQSISPFHDFGKLMDPSFYSPFPDDWIVGIADIVQSTQAIAERRYKAVNMAGAAVIAALTNALAGEEFPFVFGGDGASFAVSPADIDLARDALAATAAWVNDDLGLTMRASLIPLKNIQRLKLQIYHRYNQIGNYFKTFNCVR